MFLLVSRDFLLFFFVVSCGLDMDDIEVGIFDDMEKQYNEGHAHASIKGLQQLLNS